MIFRLTYCNKAGTEAVVDIQKGTATPVYAVEGTDNPFTLFYNNDRGDKSGSVRSSGADVNIYETAEFNIDELKTSNETEISVKYYINDVLQWSGFVIPDFFSKQITGGAGVVSMVASDRLSTLKGVTLSGLSAKISNRALAEMCLANTGLSLPLYTMADFTGDGVNIFNSEVLSQRMIDTKGRSISCYDILSSLLEQTNSLLIQRAGAWHIINKVQLEVGSGSLYSNATTSTAWSENTVNFSNVNVGARRTIIPVASMVGVYHEHGGGRLHPDNYDFSQGLTGWTAINGFNAVVENRSIEGYTPASNPIRMVPNYGEVTTKNTIRSINPTPGFDPDYDIVPYLKSPDIPIVSVNDDVVDINVDVSAIGPHNAAFRYVVLATKGATRLYLNASGTFEPFVATDERHISFLSFGQPGINIASVKSRSIAGKLDNPAGYSISVRVYGSGEGNPVFINFASVSFSNADNIPKGTMYKREQGANYTKTHEIPTVLWGDYLTNGLDGYFYEYPIDDTSSLYLPNGSLHSTWTAYGDTDQIPLLQHISRQKARMFSVAHDLLTADIDAVNFDPLSIFVDCNDKRYVVVSSKVDFLRSRVSVDLEEVVYTNNTVRDFIYSYFGDGESGIKSIGGISGGAASGGGVTHSHANKDVIDQLTQLNIDVLSKLSLYQTGVEMVQAVDEFGAPIVDEFGAPVMIEKLVPVIDSFGNPILDVNGDPVMETVPVYAVKSSVSIISEKEITAYGIGEEGGGGGGGSYDMLLSWANYTSEKSNWVISAALGKGLHDRVTTLEAGGVGGSVAWADITGKPSTFTPSAHSHVISDVSGLETALSGKASSSHSHGWSEITGKPSTFAPSSHSHGWSEITGKPSTFTPSSHSHGMADISDLSATLGSYVTVGTTQTITGAKTFSAALTASTSVSTPILNLGNGWTIEAGTNKIEVKQSGTVRARFESTGFVSTGELTAYS